MAKQNQSLREFQESLRQRMDAARDENASEKVVMLGFSAGGRQYLVDGRDVIDVHQTTVIEPIPIAKPWAIGAANIQGSVHTITDFAVLMGGDRIKKGKFLTISPHIMEGAAFLIDGTSGLFDPKDVGELSLAREAGMPEWISGFYQMGQRYFLVDAKKLASDQRFSKLQNGESQ